MRSARPSARAGQRCPDLGDLPAERFAARLMGNRLEAFRRHGKHLLVRLTKARLAHPLLRHDRQLSWFEDERTIRPMTGCAWISKAAAISPTSTGGCSAGSASQTMPTPSSRPRSWAGRARPGVRLRGFRSGLARPRRDVKSVLMDQALIAGIGNIYADEILFQARLHPKTAAPRSTIGNAATCSRRSSRCCKRRSRAAPAPSSSSTGCPTTICSRTATKAASARAAATLSRRSNPADAPPTSAPAASRSLDPGSPAVRTERAFRSAQGGARGAAIWLAQ